MYAIRTYTLARSYTGTQYACTHSLAVDVKVDTVIISSHVHAYMHTVLTYMLACSYART